MMNGQQKNGKPMRFLIYKRSGTAEVLLLPHKNTDQYSFVNLTKGHICPCVFSSVADAMKDLEERKAAGKLESYEAV